MNNENDFQRLIKQLQFWNGRRRLRDSLIWGPRGLLVGLFVAVVVATVARLRPFLTNQEVAYLAGAAAAAGLLVGLAVVPARRMNLLQRAHFADFQFSLQERSSTAVEIHQQLLAVPPIMARQQLHDTLTAVDQVDTKTALPLRLRRQDWLMILLAVLLLGTAVLLPNAQEKTLLEQRAVQETIEEQIAALESLSEEIVQNPELTPEQQEELTAPLASAIGQLQEGGITQEEAVATLSETEAELRDLAAENSGEQLRQALQTIGQPLAGNEGAAQEVGAALQNGNLSQAGAAAAQLADQLPQMSAAELSQLAQDLAETAANLQGVDDQLAQQFAAAAQALQNGDIAAAQEALRDASGTLQQRAQEAAVAQQAQDAAGQLSEGRQEVAQAGQPGQGQGQQPGEGQGQGQGEGQGEGQGQGQGQGEGQGSGTGSEQGEGTGGPGPGGGHSENVYAPELVDLSDVEGVDIELPAECTTNPENCGALLNETPTEIGDESSVVPYEQVFGDYRDAANEALTDDYIPLGLKGYIRDYFSSLEP